MENFHCDFCAKKFTGESYYKHVIRNVLLIESGNKTKIKAFKKMDEMKEKNLLRA